MLLQSNCHWGQGFDAGRIRRMDLPLATTVIRSFEYWPALLEKTLTPWAVRILGLQGHHLSATQDTRLPVVEVRDAVTRHSSIFGQILAAFLVASFLAACVGTSARKTIAEISAVAGSAYDSTISLPPNQTYWRLAFEAPNGMAIPGNARISIENIGSSDVSVNYAIYRNSTLAPNTSMVVFDGALSKLLKDSWGGVTLNCHPTRGPLELRLYAKFSGSQGDKISIIARTADGP